MKYILPILVGLLILATACTPKIECTTDEDCLIKHLEACKEYTMVAPATSSLIADFNGNLDVTSTVNGELQNDKCGLVITVNSVANELDSWAVGNSMTCYTTPQELMADGKDDTLLKNSCSGPLADEIRKHCGPRTNSDGTTTYGSFYCDR